MHVLLVSYSLLFITALFIALVIDIEGVVLIDKNYTCAGVYNHADAYNFYAHASGIKSAIVNIYSEASNGLILNIANISINSSVFCRNTNGSFIVVHAYLNLTTMSTPNNISMSWRIVLYVYEHTGWGLGYKTGWFIDSFDIHFRILPSDVSELELEFSKELADDEIRLEVSNPYYSYWCSNVKFLIGNKNFTLTDLLITPFGHPEAWKDRSLADSYRKYGRPEKWEDLSLFDRMREFIKG